MPHLVPAEVTRWEDTPEMLIALLLVYVVVGAVLLVLLAGFDGPAFTAAFRRDLRALRAHGSLAVAAGGPVWVAGAVAAWPVVVTCEAINWRERP